MFLVVSVIIFPSFLSSLFSFLVFVIILIFRFSFYGILFKLNYFAETKTTKSILHKPKQNKRTRTKKYILERPLVTKWTKTKKKK